MSYRFTEVGALRWIHMRILLGVIAIFFDPVLCRSHGNAYLFRVWPDEGDRRSFLYRYMHSHHHF